LEYLKTAAAQAFSILAIINAAIDAARQSQADMAMAIFRWRSDAANLVAMSD
jgi:hypothetical protein